MFVFRLNKVKLIDNKTGKGWPFVKDDKATIQFWSIVTVDSIDLPNLQDYMNENDAAKKKVIAASLVQDVAQSALMTPVQGIRDGVDVTFGDTGVPLYFADKMPDRFCWEFTCLKLNDKTRDIGQQMVDTIHDEKFDSFAGNLPKLIGKAANPAFTAGVEIGKFIFNIIGKNLAKKKDKQLGILQTGFFRQLDYPNGKRDSQNVQDESGNMRIDYTIFGTE